MDVQFREKKALKLFLILTIGMSAVWEASYIITYKLTGYQNQLLLLLLMWTPGMVGIIISHVYYRKQNALGIRLGRIRFVLIGACIPIIYLVISYKIAWFILGDPTIGIHGLATVLGYQNNVEISPMIYIVITFLIGLFTSCISAFGEELGWRGFMYPVMERVMGRMKALILSGLIWACWHMPLMLVGLYQAETVLWYKLLMFTIEVVMISVIMSWLRIVSNSVIPALFVHASHNFLDQRVFQIMSTKEKIPYWAGEQGFITIIFVTVIAAVCLYLWKSKNE